MSDPTFAVVGLSREELCWVRVAVRLLRSNENGSAELCRQALAYVAHHSEPITAEAGAEDYNRAAKFGTV